MITLTAFGAAEEVTGSKHMLDTGDARVLVDCGIFQGHREEARRKNQDLPFSPRDITVCVNTHGHLDHCGAYPLLVKKGYNGNIFSTPATRDIAGLVMMDSARIQAHDAQHLAKRQKKHPRADRKVFEPLYDEHDAETALSQFVSADYRRPHDIAKNVRATFHDAGHILGSSLVRFEVRNANGNTTVGFTGDLGRSNMPILRDPEVIPPVDYLVCESTYGNRLHDEYGFAEEELAAIIRDTVKRGGRVIMPAFAVERTQELVYILHKLHDAGRIPVVPVFVDSPMAVSATAIFRAHPECYDRETVEQFLDNGESPFRFDALKYVTNAEVSKSINTLPEPCIIIATSGMCEAGRILHHLIHGIGDPRNAVLIVGFMAANTLGRALADKRPEVRIFGEKHQVRATVKIFNVFSAHADYREIGEYVTKLDASRLKGVYLVHGEPDAQSALRQHLLGLGVPNVVILKAGKPVQLD